MSAVAEPQERKIPTSVAPISLAALKATSARKLDLYVLGDNGQPALFRSRDYPITAADFRRMERKQIRTLYVADGTVEKLAAELRENLTEVLSGNKLTDAERFHVLRFAMETEVDNAFKRLNANEAITTSRDMGKHLVGMLQNSQVVPQQLYYVMKHDFTTYTHIVNTSSYCVLLAQKLGITDPQQLQEIAMGGMLHDIGKMQIPASILQKPGRLTGEEMDIIKRHPTTGYAELCIRTDVTDAQLMMTYQHHEQLTGGGYPVGCVGDEIHEWAKMCAVVDIFDAVTGERPYRRPMRRVDALEMLDGKADTHLDAEMVRCWTSAMDES